MRGFTLIELMVAISIVAILSTIGIVSFSKTQEVARDSKRKSDLRSIVIALELYRQKNGSYPITGGWVYSTPGGNWIPGLTSNYISQMPQDPKQVTNCIPPQYPWNNASCFTYGYISDAAGGVPGQDFILVARLENSNDTQAGKTVQYGTTTFPSNTPINGVFSLSD